MAQSNAQEVRTECPVCHTPINQNHQYWQQPASTCDNEACIQELRRISQNERKARSRDRLREQRREEEKALDQRIRDYSTTLQPQYAAVLLSIHEHYGRALAASVVEMIEAERREAEAQRCKHDNISTILDAYARCQRQAEGAKRHNKELRARVQELEEDVQVYQSFENKVIGRVAQEDLRKQPDLPGSSSPSSLSAPGEEE